MSKPLFIEANIDSLGLWEKHVGKSRWSDEDAVVALDELPARIAAFRAELPEDATHISIRSASGYEGDHWLDVVVGRVETPAEVAERKAKEEAAQARWEEGEVERLRKRIAQLEAKKG